jgi:hypothetical protein
LEDFLELGSNMTPYQDTVSSDRSIYLAPFRSSGQLLLLARLSRCAEGAENNNRDGHRQRRFRQSFSIGFSPLRRTGSES